MTNEKIDAYIKSLRGEPAKCFARCAAVALKQNFKMPNPRAFALGEPQAKEIARRLTQLLEEKRT